jgi:hypothetical protein
MKAIVTARLWIDHALRPQGRGLGMLAVVLATLAARALHAHPDLVANVSRLPSSAALLCRDGEDGPTFTTTGAWGHTSKVRRCSVLVGRCEA